MNVIIYSFQISHSARLKIIFNHILIKLRTQGNNNEVTSTKSSTRSQVNDPELFKHHKKNRFTASLCNRLDSHGPETSKRFKTIALLFVVMRSRSLIESYDIIWALSRTSCNKT